MTTPFCITLIQLNEKVVEGRVWVRDRDRAIHTDMTLSDADLHCDTYHRDDEFVANNLVFSKCGIPFLISTNRL